MKASSLLKRSALWPLVAPAYPDTARLIAQEPTFRRLLRGNPFSGVCLNAGCGEGLYLPLLESFPTIQRIENVDLNDPARFARVYTDRRHRFSQGSLTELPFPEGSFDCCLCTEVLEHIPDHERAVAELARVLKTGGRMLVSVPQNPAPWDPAHIRQGYSLDELRNLLGAHGFVVAAWEDCLYGLTRWIMNYWRRPWIRFGAGRIPYLPGGLANMLARLDGRLAVGHPWDLAVLAIRR